MCSSLLFKVKATNSAGEAKQTKSENSKGSHLPPQSTDSKLAEKSTDKTLPLKPTSKLVALKRKEEIAEKERGPQSSQSSVSKEKPQGKEEKKTPKKEKISPKKAEVGAIHWYLVSLVEFTGKQFSVVIVYISLLSPSTLNLLGDFQILPEFKFLAILEM